MLDSAAGGQNALVQLDPLKGIRDLPAEPVSVAEGTHWTEMVRVIIPVQMEWLDT